MTLTSTMYDTLRRTSGTSTLFSVNLASFPPPSLGTHALLTSSTPYMTGTPTILSSYQPTPTHPPIAITDGQTCLVKGHDNIVIILSIPFTQVLYVSRFLANLLSISVITCALRCSITFYLFHCTFQDLTIGWKIGLGRENGRRVYKLIFDKPSSDLWALFVTTIATSSLLWH